MRSIKHISIIGSGNVATHLGHGLFAKGLVIDAVYSRKINRAKKLANKIKAKSTASLNKLPKDSDLYIIAVSDDAIDSVASKLEQLVNEKSILAHTSGSVSAGIFNRIQSGVFYPLQSFSLNRSVDLRAVPFCIYSHEDRVVKLLTTLAKKLSKEVNYITDEQRSALHLAAVFSSNFTNHMYHIAAGICKVNQVDFNILKPLILETATKIKSESPHNMQTGPARRGDQKTINIHLKKLTNNKSSKDIYSLISKNIKSQYTKG